MISSLNGVWWRWCTGTRAIGEPWPSGPAGADGCDAKTKRRNTQRMQFRGYRYRGLVICIEDNDYIKLFSSEPCNLRIWMNFVTHNYILRMKHACEYYTNGIVWHSYRMCEPTCDLSGITWCTGRITMTSLTKHPPKWLEIEVCEAPSFAQNRDSYVGPSSSPSWSPMSPYFEAILDPSWSQVVQVGPKLGPSWGHFADMWGRNGEFGRCCADVKNVQITTVLCAFWRTRLENALPQLKLFQLNSWSIWWHRLLNYHASPLSVPVDFIIQISSWQPQQGLTKPRPGFVRFATKEGATRVLEEDRVMFQRRAAMEDPRWNSGTGHLGLQNHFLATHLVGLMT